MVLGPQTLGKKGEKIVSHGSIFGKMFGVQRNASRKYNANTLLTQRVFPPYYLVSERKGICNITAMNLTTYFHKIFVFTIFIMTVFCWPLTGLALQDAPGTVNKAALELVKLCSDSNRSLDENALVVLMDYVLSSKEQNEYALSKSQGCAGAYYEFDTKTSFSRFMDYTHNSLIPATITRPSSLRHSTWTHSRSSLQDLLNGWEPVPPLGAPVVIHASQRDAITPDLTTGSYYEYNLKRTLILLNHKGRQALISISKQVGESDVGKKGVILGKDEDWNYYYSGQPGTTKAGLGWAKSYIYDYFSVVVYTESNSTSDTVRTSAFQWLRAGWSGINFVKSNHILSGMKRFARNSKAVLESPNLPPPDQMVSVYQWLSALSIADLSRKYAGLQQGLRQSAVKLGKIGKSGGTDETAGRSTPKEQMIEELMLEYLKICLGKPTLINRQTFPHHLVAAPFVATP